MKPIYKKGTKFIVCDHDGLIKKGWIFDQPDDKYSHDDFPGDSIIRDMMQYFGAKLTVSYPSTVDGWYQVKENSWKWPVATFLLIGTWVDDDDHTCEEGITPIDGWVICKICGDNIREIK